MVQPQQRYRVVERIAAGGMAEVYRAESAGLEGFKKTVAIKRVLTHLSKKEQFIGMFLDEARLSARLSHSNCVQVFDIGVGDGTYFIVMEYVDGSDLKRLLEHCRKTGRVVPVSVACLIAQRICEGLAYAHSLEDSQGQPLHIVHRDVSPPNVLITKYGEIKVVDFGLAKANSQLERSEPGIIKGKFSYLSPEAASGEVVDHRTDIFATGIILWEMLAGRRLFLGDSDLATVRQVQAANIPSLCALNPTVPRSLDIVVQQALERDPRERYQNGRDFGSALTRILFDLDEPVDSWDVATLIGDVVEEKQRQTARTSSAPERSTLIGSLIQDAIMKFTSLREGGSDSGRTSDAPVGAKPLNLASLEAPTSWEAKNAARSQRKSVQSAYQAGNLAALEEDAAGHPLMLGVDEWPGVASVHAPGLPSLAPPAPRKWVLVVFTLCLIAAAGALGAYLGSP